MKIIKHIWPYIIILFITVALYFPVRNMHFYWVDDGYAALQGNELIDATKKIDIQKISQIFIERQDGRFRPIHWISQAFVVLFSGNSATWNMVIHFILVYLQTVYLYKIILFFTKNISASLLLAILFLTFPHNAENWYRTRTQEPLLTLLLLLSLYNFFTAKIIPAIYFLFMSFLTKETAMAITPIIIIYYAYEKVIIKTKKLINLKYYCLASIIFSLIITIITISTRNGYGAKYSYQLGDAMANFIAYNRMIFFEYDPIFYIFLAIFFVRLFIHFKKPFKPKENQLIIVELFFLLLYLAYILIQSPWPYVLGRYTLTASAMLMIFFGFELANMLKVVNSKLFLKLIIIVFAFYFFNSIIRSYNYGSLLAYRANNVFKMLTAISKFTPPSQTVYFNFPLGSSTREPVYETGLHLKLWYNRPDIKINYLTTTDLAFGSIIVSSDFVGYNYSNDILTSNIKLVLVDEINTSANLSNISNPYNITKQLFKKIIKAIFMNKNIDLEGIYAPYKLQNTWKIYQVI